MSLKANLTQAKTNKKDEFYTQLKDIENELRHYKEHFKGKTVYCNADDPRVSNFFHYFSYNFEHLGLKKLITTCYKNQEMDLFSMHDQESAIALIYEEGKWGELNKRTKYKYKKIIKEISPIDLTEIMKLTLRENEKQLQKQIDFWQREFRFWE